jgi:hypothetical protein
MVAAPTDARASFDAAPAPPPPAVLRPPPHYYASHDGGGFAECVFLEGSAPLAVA